MPRHLTSMPGHRTPDTGHRTPDTGHRTCEGSGKRGGVKPCKQPFQRRGLLLPSGVRGAAAVAPPGAPVVLEANGFHSHKASGIPREATGLIHPSTGQGTRPTASFILAQGNALGHPAQQTTQPEGLPHHAANRRLPHHEAGLQPAIDLSPFSPGRCPGLVCRRPLASIQNPQSSILNPQSSILNPQSSITNHQSPISNLQSPTPQPP